jgi:hypothetical protein
MNRNKLLPTLICEKTSLKITYLFLATLAALGFLSIALKGKTVSAQAPPTGFLEVCKDADGAGVTGEFTFTINGPGGFTTTRSVQVGACSPIIELPAGTITITEAARAGFELSGVTAASGGGENRLVSSNLATRTATVTVVAGGPATETFVRFRNRTVQTGFLEVCKDADGAGVTGEFTFTVTSGAFTTTRSVQVGACSPIIELPAGTVTITEAARAGFEVCGITAASGGGENRLVSSNLATRTATVTVVAGGPATETFVRFCNRAVPPPTGTLKVCKVAGEGVTIGTLFTFDITAPGFPAQTVQVPAGSSTDPGQCVIDGTYPVGTQVTVTERVPANIQVSAITVLPSDRVVGTPNLAGGSAVVSIGPGTTEVIFTNRVRANGTLKVCKVAGEGVTIGTLFTFDITAPGFPAQTVQVPAGSSTDPGQCVIDGTYPVGTRVTVTERVPAGFRVSSITTLGGANPSTNPAGGTVSIDIGPGTTEVIFTNSRLLLACTFSQGFFKNHAEALPATLRIGQTTLTRAQLVAVLQTPVRGNCAVSLAHQLIAALANIQRGPAPADVQADINAAIAALANCSITFAGGRSNDAIFSCNLGQSACDLAGRLGAFNEGNRGVPHCEE